MVANGEDANEVVIKTLLAKASRCEPLNSFEMDRLARAQLAVARSRKSALAGGRK